MDLSQNEQLKRLMGNRKDINGALHVLSDLLQDMKTTEGSDYVKTACENLVMAKKKMNDATVNVIANVVLSEIDK